MAEAGPRIALIHALAASVAPAHAAFAELWPEAWHFDLFDSALSADRAAGGAEAAMTERCVSLADYAAGARGVGGRTSAILFTCSAFGAGIEAAAKRHTIPVLKPNQAAFEQALALGPDLGLVVTFEPSKTALEAELYALGAATGQPVRVTAILAEGAIAAHQAGDLAGHDERIAEATARLGARDAILLGQFSMSRALAAAAAQAAAPVLTTPHAAVAALKRLSGQ